MKPRAVRCPGCGREYSSDLFEHGRVIDCTCGSAVGIEVEALPTSERRELRFVADAMLGRLAHWLRLLGFDTVWSDQISQAEVARHAWDESRIALTRSRSLAARWRLPRAFVLESCELREQLRQLDRSLSLIERGDPLTRCSRCNAPLEDVAVDRIRARVPPRILNEQSHFRSCPRCERIYWRGSHVDRIERELRELREAPE